MENLLGSTLVVRSHTFDPWRNLALEQLLTELIDADEISGNNHPAILYLWQNEHTVVIGRNQNAWAECHVGLLESEAGRLARRSTGGGAVYHDLGNLNYSLILPRRAYNVDANFQLIIDAVRSLDIAATRSGRNDLLVEGRKFSGNAFSQKKNTGLHHGTLLVNSDYEKISRYLNVDPGKFAGKGVASVRSRVINLSEINPGLTLEMAAGALENVFLARYGGQNIVHHLEDHSLLDQERLAELENFYKSWDWRYGQTMKFDARIEQRFTWGYISLGFNIEKGLVRKLTVYSDALDSDFLELLPVLFTGCRFHSPLLASILESADLKDPGYGPGRILMAENIAGLILRQNW